jgi:hypothetical protein
VIPAAPPVVGILDSGKLKTLFPLGVLFQQRHRAEADFNRAWRAVVAYPGGVYVAQVFIAGDAAVIKRSGINRLERGPARGRVSPALARGSAWPQYTARTVRAGVLARAAGLAAHCGNTKPPYADEIAVFCGLNC